MNYRKLTAAAFSLAIASSAAHAGFHVMQIEQFIGGLNGDKTAQAIQLRLRGAGQTIVSASRLKAYDAAGANPVLLLDITSNVANGSVGDNILIASPSFNIIMAAVGGYASDFTLASVVPASYLTGGKVTFEDDSGTIYWSLAFGAYTGSNAGNTTNDADGNFGAPAAAPPTNARQGLLFPGAASAGSTTNQADYSLSANPATVRNNARSSFVVAPEPTTAAMLALGGLAGLAFFRRRQS